MKKINLFLHYLSILNKINNKKNKVEIVKPDKIKETIFLTVIKDK